MSDFRIVQMNIDDVKPYENNPRFNDKAVDAVANSIENFGFKVPIVVDKYNVIVTGHTRLKAAKKLGLAQVPVIVADDLSEEKIKAFRLADNKVSELAEWDFNALDAELANISEIDMSLFSFDIKKLDPDNFGEDFQLADGEKNPIGQMSFVLHEEQMELIKYAISIVGECSETFGNTNRNGNALYEVVKQWAALKN